MKKEIDTSVGKRKKAVARANVVKGTGKIRINSKLLELVEPRYVKYRIQEPLLIAQQIHQVKKIG